MAPCTGLRRDFVLAVEKGYSAEECGRQYAVLAPVFSARVSSRGVGEKLGLSGLNW